MAVQSLAVIGTERRSGRSHIGRMSRRSRRRTVRRRNRCRIGVSTATAAARCQAARAAAGTAGSAVSVHVEMGRREHLGHIVDVHQIVVAARTGLVAVVRRRSRSAKLVRLRRLRTATTERAVVRWMVGVVWVVRRMVRMVGRRRSGRRRRIVRLALDGRRRAARVRAEMVGILADEEIAHVRSAGNVIAMQFLVRRVDDGGDGHRSCRRMRRQVRGRRRAVRRGRRRRRQRRQRSRGVRFRMRLVGHDHLDGLLETFAVRHLAVVLAAEELGTAFLLRSGGGSGGHGGRRVPLAPQQDALQDAAVAAQQRVDGRRRRCLARWPRRRPFVVAVRWLPLGVPRFRLKRTLILVRARGLRRARLQRRRLMMTAAEARAERQRCDRRELGDQRGRLDDRLGRWRRLPALDDDGRRRRRRRDFALLADAAVPVMVSLGHLDFDFAVLVGAPAVRLRGALLLLAAALLGGSRLFRQRTSPAGRTGLGSRARGRRFPAEIQDVVVVVRVAGIFRRRQSVVVVSVAVVSFIRADRAFRGGRQLIVSVPPGRVDGQNFGFAGHRFFLARRRVAVKRLGVAVVLDGHRSIGRMLLARLAVFGFAARRFRRLLDLWRLLRVGPVVLLDLLPYPLQHQVSGDGIVEPLGKLLAVPDQELLVGQDRLGRVKVNVHLVLAGDEVLRLGRVGRIDVSHPVGLGRVVSVDVVKDFAVVVHLGGERRRTLADDARMKKKKRLISNLPSKSICDWRVLGRDPWRKCRRPKGRIACRGVCSRCSRRRGRRTTPGSTLRPNSSVGTSRLC